MYKLHNPKNDKGRNHPKRPGIHYQMPTMPRRNHPRHPNNQRTNRVLSINQIRNPVIRPNRRREQPKRKSRELLTTQTTKEEKA